MEDTQLNELWKQYDRQLEEARILNLQSWVLNLQNFESLQTQKANAKLSGLARFKLFAAGLGVLWVAFLVFLFVHSLVWSKLFFLISTGAIIIFTSIAIAVYLYHVILIKLIKNTDSVLSAQEKLVQLQSSTLQIVRILFLQTPFYCSWFYTTALLKEPVFLILNGTIFLLLTTASVWLYKNINFKNADKKWFKILFGNIEWTSLTKAATFLNEIDEFKKELVERPS